MLNRAAIEESSSPGSKIEKEAWFSHRVLELVRAEFENRTWEVFWRIVVDGQSAAEVANSMGLSLPAVYQAKSRVLRRLRQELDGLEAD
jgi:RNA polymerase sigma-70 factor (ECF subfamily)